MTRQKWLPAVVLVAVLGVRADADVWDVSGDSGGAGTNELVPGTTQIHDLGVQPGPVADVDWYKMPQKAYSSYEVVVDGSSFRLGTAGVVFERIGVTAGGTPGSVVQTSEPAVGGASLLSPTRALRWVNDTPATVQAWVRVSGAACGTTCNSNDVYNVRVHETTVNIPRFNTNGTQQTVQLIQNAGQTPVTLSAYYWNVAGTLLQTRTTTLAPKALDVFNLGTDPALVGQSGSITVAHNGGYGAIVAKAVALEPSTGFSFDTPGVYVPD